MTKKEIEMAIGETMLKLKVVPKQIFMYGADSVETRTGYIAGWKDGTENQAKATWKAAYKAGQEAERERLFARIKSDNPDMWASQPYWQSLEKALKEGKVLEFKTISPFYEQERDGIKPFTIRQWDTSDERFQALAERHAGRKY